MFQKHNVVHTTSCLAHTLEYYDDIRSENLFSDRLLVRTCQEIFLTAHGNPAEVIEAIGRDIPLIAGISAANTITPTEVMDIMLGTRDAIKDWLERRREKARAEGRTEGQTETQAEWLAWYHRMREAQEQGLPFDEPPPVN